MVKAIEVEKKRMILRQDDQEIFAARVYRGTGDATNPETTLATTLQMDLKIHAALATVFSSGGSLDTRPERPGGNRFYNTVPPDLERILQSCRTELTPKYPILETTTASMSPYSFAPRRIYVPEGVLSFQCLRQVQLSDSRGVSFAIEGAVTQELLRIWLILARALLAKMWQEYVYPVELEATLTTREMVNQ